MVAGALVMESPALLTVTVKIAPSSPGAVRAIV
jgi:hypothetical protein